MVLYQHNAKELEVESPVFSALCLPKKKTNPPEIVEINGL